MCLPAWVPRLPTTRLPWYRRRSFDDAREAIRVARVGDRVVTYLPRTTALTFKLDGARGWTATVLDMEDKRIAKLPVRDNGDGTVRVAQHPFEHDALGDPGPGR